MNIVDVAVNFPVGKGVLSYLATESYPNGTVVTVPLGKREALGVVLRPKEESSVEEGKLKSILGIDDRYSVLSANELELFQWMSQYYHYSLGKLIFDALPPALKRPRKVAFLQGKQCAWDFHFSLEQEQTYKKLAPFLSLGFSQHLIHGVTGSGKSILFLKLIKETLAEGKSAQFLLPEINLTPQFTQLFEKYLDCPIYTYHSGVTRSEKYHIYQALKGQDQPVLVMGVRSSVFLPIQNLGLVIVDEEHDSSFKQEDRCPYSARDVAVKKAQLHRVPIVLGSATPKLESYYHFKNAEQGKHYYPLAKRVGRGELPELEFLDLRDQLSQRDPTWPLLPQSIKAIAEHLERGEQVLVFVNRLGFASFLQCSSCGHQFQNEDCGCGLNLRYFKAKNLLSCGHCEYKVTAPKVCPECGCMDLWQRGFGTEKVQELLAQLFANKRVERFDRDELKTTSELTQKLERFQRGEVDILVGTQMLAKGHNFPKVNLVLVLGADAHLNFADFRAQEKVYQLLKQVSGRAGRFQGGGKVLVQTYDPNHPIYQHVVSETLESFYESELPMRQLAQCPPFAHLSICYFSGRDRERLIATISQAASQLQEVIKEHLPSVSLLGPVPSVIEKRAHQFSWVMMMKSTKRADLHRLLSIFEKNYRPVSGISLKVDVDPVQSF